MILTLLSVRWLTIKNAFLRSTPSERRRARHALALSTIIVLGIGTLSYGFFFPFAQIGANDTAMRTVLSRLPAFAFFSAFWLLLLSAVTVGIQTFYVSLEIPLLLSTPARPRTLFIAKFIEATATNAMLFLTAGTPMLLAYSLARGSLTAAYLCSLAVTLVAFSALPTGLGILLSILLMRVLPAHRTRDLLAAVGVSAFAGVYFVLSTGVSRLHGSDPTALHQGTRRLAAVVTRPLFYRGPWAWAGEALSGDYSALATWQRAGWLVLMAAAAIWLCALVAHGLHLHGWSNAQETAEGARRRSHGESLKPVGRGALSSAYGLLFLLPGPIRAVYVKDFWSLQRDMRQLSMLFIPIAVVAVFLSNVPQQPQFHRVEPVLLALTLLVVLAPISLRLAVAAFAGENRAFWLMLAAPNDPVKILAGKYCYACSLAFPLTVIATLVYAVLMHLSGAQASLCLAIILCAMAGFSGIGVGASALFSDLTTDHARFTVSTGGRLLIFGVQVGYLSILAVVMVGASMLMGLSDLPQALIIAAAAGIVVILSVTFAMGSLLLGARRLRRLEW